MKQTTSPLVTALLLAPLAVLHAAEPPKPAVNVTQQLFFTIHVTPKLIFKTVPAYARKYLPFASYRNDQGRDACRNLHP